MENPPQKQRSPFPAHPQIIKMGADDDAVICLFMG